MTEPISPSVWRRAKRNTARSVRAVRMARGEYQCCPPRLPTSAAHLGCPPRLPTSAAHLGCPRLDGFVGDPDGQAPTLTQAGVIGRPVRDPVRLLGNVVAAGLVQLEGQGKHPRSDGGRRPTPPRPQPQPPSRSVQHSRIHLVGSVAQVEALSCIAHTSLLAFEYAYIRG